MNAPETAALLSAVAQLYPTVRPSPLMCELWSSALDDVTYEQALAALQHHVRESKYPPNPGALREILFGTLQPAMEPVKDLWGRTILHPDGSPKMRQAGMLRLGGIAEPATPHETLTLGVRSDPSYRFADHGPRPLLDQDTTKFVDDLLGEAEGEEGEAR